MLIKIEIKIELKEQILTQGYVSFIYYSLIQLANLPKSEPGTIPNSGENVEQQGIPFTDGRNIKWYNHFGNNLLIPHKRNYTIQQLCSLVFT